MKEEKITLSRVKELGFSDKMIRDLLPEPELAQNPMYQSGYPMKLYLKKDVYAVMESEKYKEYKAVYEKRKLSSMKATETKKRKLEQAFEEKMNNISVQRIPMDLLEEYALESRQSWYNYKGNELDVYTADEQTKARWKVNYIRHELTKYDRDLFGLKGKVGKHDVYFNYRAKVLQTIAEVYPELADECNRVKEPSHENIGFYI